jgi:hypothetical protein
VVLGCWSLNRQPDRAGQFSCLESESGSGIRIRIRLYIRGGHPSLSLLLSGMVCQYTCYCVLLCVGCSFVCTLTLTLQFGPWQVLGTTRLSAGDYCSTALIQWWATCILRTELLLLVKLSDQLAWLCDKASAGLSNGPRWPPWM